MKALISPVLLMTFLSTAQAYDYVDSKGYRHWNHYGDPKGTRTETVQNPNQPKVEIIQDNVKFRPLEEAAGASE
jgi:hypothetical protein